MCGEIDVDMKFIDIDYADCNVEKITEMSKKLETIFQYNADINKTAYLNWRTQCTFTKRSKFIVMGEAFFSTAYNLIQQCILDNSDKKADSWIFPILFNIVHGIEVYLKAINVSLSFTQNKDRKITEGKHDIKGLCKTAKNLIIKFKTEKKNKTTEEMFVGIKVVERFINNIYEKTEDMSFARYPFSSKEDKQFYVNSTQNEVIDLEILYDQIVYIYKLLNFIFEMAELDLEQNNGILED